MAWQRAESGRSQSNPKSPTAGLPGSAKHNVEVTIKAERGGSFVAWHRIGCSSDEARSMIRSLPLQAYDIRMIRVPLVALLLLVATSASADWVKVTDDGDAVYYVDPATVVDKPEFRQAQVLHDYAKPEPGGVRSRQVLYDLQCAAERLRSVSATEYAEPMAKGNRVNAWERVSDWHYVAPRTGSNIPSRTPYRLIVRFVCSR